MLRYHLKREQFAVQLELLHMFAQSNFFSPHFKTNSMNLNKSNIAMLCNNSFRDNHHSKKDIKNICFLIHIT